MARRRTRKNAKRVTTTTVVKSQVPKGNRAKSKGSKRRRGSKRNGKRGMSRISPHGLEFLQCAISPQDFPGTKPGGVPDEYAGPSFVMRHKAVYTVTMTTSAMTLLFAPVPGAAFFRHDGFPSEDAVYTQNVFPEWNTLFGTGPGSEDGTQSVSKFRLISHNIEMKPITPLLPNAGLLTAARVPGLGMIEHNVPATGIESTRVSGLQSLSPAGLSSMPGGYLAHVNEGAYGWGLNDSGVWPITNLWVGTSQILSTDGNGTLSAATGNNIMGWGHLTPSAVCVSSANANLSFAIQVEQCVEYFPRAGTLMAGMASPSPPHDPVALASYAVAARKMPAFCPTRENDGFWEKFLSIISSISGAMSAVPTPYSALFGGISTVSAGIRDLIA